MFYVGRENYEFRAELFEIMNVFVKLVHRYVEREQKIGNKEKGNTKEKDGKMT